MASELMNMTLGLWETCALSAPYLWETQEALGTYAKANKGQRNKKHVFDYM